MPITHLARGIVRAFCAVALAFAATIPFAAQASYPDRPIHMVVPFSAGGPTDALARIISDYLSRNLGQAVLVDNRGGAGGRIATEFVAAAPADGYTVFFATTGTMAINPALYRSMTLKPMQAFDAVGPLATSWNVLLVLPDSPANSLKDLIVMAKAKPGQLTFGSAGVGSTNHLSGELLKQTANIDIRHIPYKGSSGAITDLLGGRISMMFDTLPTGVQSVNNKQAKALFQTGPTRAAALPDIPTAAEAGLPGFEVTTFFGLVAPKGTPLASRERLNKALNEVLSQKEVKQKLLDAGAIALPGTQKEFEKMIQDDIVKWNKLVKDANAYMD
jgi:tripartite-type tricarboxylate transporter receptor subunit TctC